MAKVMKRGTDIHGRWKVWVRDEDQRVKDDQIEMAMTGQYPTMATPPPSEIVMALGRSVVVRSAVRMWRERFAGKGTGTGSTVPQHRDG